MKNRNLIECRELTKNFGSKVALDRVDLNIGRGKVVGLLGPNGSGKTTLIKLMNGLIRPTYGEVLMDGQQPGTHTKAIISYLPDRTYFADWMTVKDILDMFSEFYEDFDRSKAEDMCASMNINVRDRIKTMSKGTKEKVQLILVMSREADLYLLDEPIGGVDPAARDYILETIIAGYRENATLVISTHLIADVEKILDGIVFLKEGRIAQVSSVEEIRENEGKSVDALFREVFRC